jgi:uncharacterized membrane protein
MERIFTFFFKYRPLLFQEGDFVMLSPWPILITLLVVGVVAAVGILTYSKSPGKATKVERGVMIALRMAALFVLMFCLFQPALVLTSPVPQRNFVGVLIDDSKSMTLPDEDGKTRADLVNEQFNLETSDIVKQLAERFSLRFYRFSSELQRIVANDELTFNGTRTDLATALTRAREDLSSVPVSGFVVVSDGGDNGGAQLPPALIPLQAASIPVFTVGLGEEEVAPDIQIDRVDLPRTVLKGTSLVVDVLVSGKGTKSESAQLVVEDNERILSQQDVPLNEDGEPSVSRVRFTLDDVGPQRIRFRVTPQQGERVTQNNQRTLLVDVTASVEKILYFEGEPRFEVKFMRRAVQGDDQLQLAVLQRTAEDKYLRLDIDEASELEGGFPKTREELFQYKAIVLGSVEASYFTHDQLVMISEFVSQRGGGLLLIGGRNSFAEGGFEGTPLEDVMPVILEAPARDVNESFTELKVHPTLAGQNHPATQILPGQQAENADWDKLPPLSTLNRIVRAKPGATVLLEGTTPSGENRVVLAHQRFGKGKVLALPVQDTWIWQMHASIPLDDLTHETFWRQMLRWVVDGVPARVAATAEREQVEENEAVQLRAEVMDSAYRGVNNALVSASVTAPDGTQQTVNLEWTLEQDGEYTGTFKPIAGGNYDVVVQASREADGRSLGSDAVHVFVGPSDAEFFDAAQQRSLLERVANDTGGRYYTLANLANLPEDLQYTGGGVTLTEEKELWDMPFLFLMLVVLVGSEWLFRRRRGLI